jgi:hypothetical protein
VEKYRSIHAALCLLILVAFAVALLGGGLLSPIHNNLISRSFDKRYGDRDIFN